MRFVDDTLTFSATDLASFFECAHKTVLDLRVARKELERPGQSDIERRMLEKRGGEHERRVREYFREQGRDVVDVAAEAGGVAASESAAAATLNAMEAGVDLIYQGVLVAGDWVGRPDFLVRTEVPPGKGSRFGEYLYEPIDAKLARDEKARAVIQLCAYADQLEQHQGMLPERIWLALGTREIEPRALRTGDYFFYYRRAKARLQEFAGEDGGEVYPEPVEHCDVCAWWKRCEERRRDDDHLSLVAGITRRQRTRLVDQGVEKLVQLAQLPATQPVDGIDEAPLAKIRHQARLQHERRTDGKAVYDLLTDADPGSGLELLPVRKPGDLFLDLEGDAFVHDGGLEYLFGLLELGKPEDGFSARTKPGPPRYSAIWALNRAEEKAAFERVMDRIKLGREEFRDLHVFHYGHRENTALKTLSCRHATREDEVDELLREDVLVDLHAVVRQGLRASVEAYTLKELEVLHGFQRQVERRKAAKAMQLFGFWLETGESTMDVGELRETLARYNEEDCLSTWKLRDWLEERRTELERKTGRVLSRPQRKDEEGDDKKDERDEEAAAVERKLTEGLPDNSSDDTPEHAARRLLADLLGWHWRELKSSYWEYHQARKVPPSEWLESRFILADLNYEGVVGEVKQSFIHEYSFPDQEHAVREFPTPMVAGTEKKSANVEEIGPNFVRIKRGKRNKDPHAMALRPGRPKDSADQERQLLAVAKSVAERGFNDRTEYAAARDLLLRCAPRCGQRAGAELVGENEDTVEAVKRLCLGLEDSVLAIQGPPGSGKTYRAARAIFALVQEGKKVGVTANSHQVILNVLKGVHAVATEKKVPVSIQHIDKPDKYADNPLPFAVDNKYPDAAEALASGTVQVMGGTSFAWAKECLASSVDVLIVDEAGQISLANALAVSTAAKSMVLLGDPAQLEQPQKGVHPPGADVSALEYLLGDAVTMPSDRGVFLPETRRLHPAICSFTSEAFYEGRLKPIGGLEQQAIRGPEPFHGAGLRYVPVQHQGNTNRSDEEVEAVAEIVERLFANDAKFVDKSGQERGLRTGAPAKDVLVVAPYNAQVAALTQRLPQDRVAVGTVDRFQGKEAPIVIYSMTTSSGEEAPRGLEFLYSLNRLNVATSRAQAMVILVASPELTRARCRTPRQLRLVNALCGYLAGAQIAAE